MADKIHKFLSCILLLGRCGMNMDLLDIFTWSTVISTLSLSHGSPSMVCTCQAAVEPGCATGGAAAWAKGPAARSLAATFCFLFPKKFEV